MAGQAAWGVVTDPRTTLTAGRPTRPGVRTVRSEARPASQPRARPAPRVIRWRPRSPASRAHPARKRPDRTPCWSCPSSRRGAKEIERIECADRLGLRFDVDARIVVDENADQRPVLPHEQRPSDAAVESSSDDREALWAPDREPASVVGGLSGLQGNTRLDRSEARQASRSLRPLRSVQSLRSLWSLWPSAPLRSARTCGAPHRAAEVRRREALVLDVSARERAVLSLSCQ